MPGTTTRGLPYPTDSDPLADIALAVQQLAEAVETKLPAGGSDAITTNASGQFTITHGLGRTPVVGLGMAGGNRMAMMTSQTSTTATFTVRNFSDGGLQASIALTVDWFVL